MDKIPRRPIFYRLDGDTPYPVSNTPGRAYHQWLEEHRHVDLEEFANPRDPDGVIRISTVFLGIDHNWGLRGDPTLWETMVFAKGWGFDRIQERYTSAEAARKGHNEIVAEVAAAIRATVN